MVAVGIRQSWIDPGQAKSWKNSAQDRAETNRYTHNGGSADYTQPSLIYLEVRADTAPFHYPK
jgi:hypothetical protein